MWRGNFLISTMEANMGRSSVRAAAVVTLAALFTGTATASFGAEPEEVNTPIPIDLSAGRYIVLLDEAPAATYEGGEAGLAPTKPEAGEKLDASKRDVQRYSDFLEERQRDVATEAGVTPDGTLTITLNAFTANLTAAQAAKLAGADGVKSVVPDEILHPDAVPSTEFLGLEGDAGVWNAVGGVDQAGAGTVVGVIDTGIAPENPSFAGAPLGTAVGAEPYLDGNTVVYAKADGNTFRSDRVTGEEWDVDDYSTKLVGAKYFSAGAAAAGFDFAPDYLSPRDADGHGSHTAGTAAGNHDVAASVEGIDFGAISGVAPAARVAAYKACYVGPDPLITDDDICALSDLMAAINAAADRVVDDVHAVGDRRVDRGEQVAQRADVVAGDEVVRTHVAGLVRRDLRGGGDTRDVTEADALDRRLDTEVAGRRARGVRAVAVAVARREVVVAEVEARRRGAVGEELRADELGAVEVLRPALVLGVHAPGALLVAVGLLEDDVVAVDVRRARSGLAD